MEQVIAPAVLKSAFVDRALLNLRLYSLEASMLLMGTAAIESNFRYLAQIGGGPATGYFQMERNTFNDLLNRFLKTKRNANLRARVLETAGSQHPPPLALMTNHYLAAAMARIRYYSHQAPIPKSLKDQSIYWWTYYNGKSPHGLKPKDYLERWNRHQLHRLFDQPVVTDSDIDQVGQMRLPAKAPDPFYLWSI